MKLLSTTKVVDDLASLDYMDEASHPVVTCNDQLCTHLKLMFLVDLYGL